MLVDKNRYKASLSDLWQRVFGDSRDFTELIFKKEYDKSVLCFAHIIDEKAVSAFYLIENALKFDSKLYKGYYLYAAATLPECRSEGLMSRLIDEALLYCEEKEVDFVSLVPSEEGLYSYYSRFGFLKAMYRYVSTREKLTKPSVEKSRTLNAAEALEMRNKYKGNIISFTRESFAYAADCLSFSGFDFFLLSDGSYLLSSPEDDFAEFICENELFSAEFNAQAKSVTSPYFLKNFTVNECVPYGMLFPMNPSLKREWKFTDIYMNIALD